MPDGARHSSSFQVESLLLPIMHVPPFVRTLTITAAALAATFLAREARSAGGDLYTKDFNSDPIIRIARDGTKTVFASGDGSQTVGMSFDRAGNLYIAAGDHILKFAPDGTRATFVSGVGRVGDLAFDSSGNLFANEANSHSILKFAPN